MDNKRHKVYQSLIVAPKIAGVSQGLFIVIIGAVMITVLMFGGTLFGIISGCFVGVILRNFLAKAEENDPIFLSLWVGKIFESNHFRPTQRIDQKRKKQTKSIPTLN